MERRQFLKKSMITAGALGLLSAKGRAFPGIYENNSSMQGFKKSIMWGTIGIEGTTLEKCKAVKKAGFDGIEPNSHMDRKEVIDAMKAAGLVASSVCCTTHGNKPLSHPDSTIRKEGIEGAIVSIDDAKAYGTDAVLLIPGFVNNDVGYDECWERSTEGIKQILPYAEKQNVKICLENVWNNFLLSPLEACRYIDQFNSKAIGFYFDCGNIMAFGFPEQWVRILGNRIHRIHVKEYNREISNNEGRYKGFNVKLGDGDVNWARIIEEAKKSYRGQWFTTEQSSSQSQTQEEMNDLCKRLDNIINL